MKKFVIHLISDSTGGTVKSACRSALSRFGKIETKKYYWPLVRNEGQLNEILPSVKYPCVVLYTISNSSLRARLKNFCAEKKIPCVSVLEGLINVFSSFLGLKPKDFFDPGFSIDENYLGKMEAMDYTIKHDDGLNEEGFEEADVVLIGPSRTSKTPTSVYLSYNGFKTANVPYVEGVQVSPFLFSLKKPLVIGLVINPFVLREIRENRKDVRIAGLTGYTDINVLKEECLGLKRLCAEKNWPVLDVTNSSIEETSAKVIKLYYSLKNKGDGFEGKA